MVPLDLAGLDTEVDFLIGEGVRSIAVCFLHAYANPSHERAAADAIRRRHPDVPVTISSEVASEWHEYERTSTAVINAVEVRSYSWPLEATSEEMVTGTSRMAAPDRIRCSPSSLVTRVRVRMESARRWTGRIRKSTSVSRPARSSGTTSIESLVDLAAGENEAPAAPAAATPSA